MHIQSGVYCIGFICVHFRCIQCVVTSDEDLFCLSCDRSVCMFVYVIGPEFDSTSPAFVTSSQPCGGDRRPVHKNGIGSPYLGGGEGIG